MFHRRSCFESQEALDGKKNRRSCFTYVSLPLFPLSHVSLTVSSLALGSYLTICENVARAAALCDLEAPGWGWPWFPHCAFVDSWLTDF